MIRTWIQHVRHRMRRFFDGEPIARDQGPLIFVNSAIRHPVAQFLLSCRDFWVLHWQWLIGTAIAIILALVVRR
jgi:hypothetical protein